MHGSLAHDLLQLRDDKALHLLRVLQHLLRGVPDVRLRAHVRGEEGATEAVGLNVCVGRAHAGRGRRGDSGSWVNVCVGARGARMEAVCVVRALQAGRQQAGRRAGVRAWMVTLLSGPDEPSS